MQNPEKRNGYKDINSIMNIVTEKSPVSDALIENYQFHYKNKINTSITQALQK